MKVTVPSGPGVKNMDMYPKIQGVEALRSKKIRVTFQVGDVKIYDCHPLLEEEPFKALADETFFCAVKAEKHGYGVTWNDDIDLAESEIWIKGSTEQEAH